MGGANTCLVLCVNAHFTEKRGGPMHTHTPRRAQVEQKSTRRPHTTSNPIPTDTQGTAGVESTHHIHTRLEPRQTRDPPYDMGAGIEGGGVTIAKQTHPPSDMGAGIGGGGV
jgi:hypothetical protein